MSLLPRTRRAVRAGLLVCLAVLMAAISAGPATAALATTPWAPLTPPWGASWSVYDVYAFGVTSLAAAGDGGHIAVSRDGGRSWKVVVPVGSEATAFTSIALATSGRGVVASGGMLLVTGDGGGTWRPPAYAGPGPSAAINDVALRGSRAVAVGDDGMILSSNDAGATWSVSASPTVSALTCVAIAGDGTVVAGSVAGEILVESADAWAIAGVVAGPVTSVAAAAAPAWGDGAPDLFAATAGDVLGSDDALAFASLPGLPDLSSEALPALAWADVPERSLLIAGSGSAGFFETPSRLWQSASSGLTGTTRAVAPGGQSVGYLLGVDGRLVRTLSAGREPATVTLSRTQIDVGGSTGLTATVRVGAPGVLRVRSRIPGRAWVTTRIIAWTAGDWNRRLSFTLSPTLTNEYALTFNYAGVSDQISRPVRVSVKPRIGTARSRYDLRVGDVFRFSGSVTPKLSGERSGAVDRPGRELAAGQPAAMGHASRRAHLGQPPVRDAQARDVSPARAPARHQGARGVLEPRGDRRDPLASAGRGI